MPSNRNSANRQQNLAAKESQILDDKLRLQQLDWASEHQEILRQKDERTAEVAQAIQQLTFNQQSLEQWQESQGDMGQKPRSSGRSKGRTYSS